MIDFFTRVRWRVMEFYYNLRFGYKKALRTTGVKSRHVFTTEVGKNHEVLSACDVQILPVPGGRFKIVLTEIEDNKWMPVTQVYADLAKAIYRGRVRKIPLSRINWYCHDKADKPGGGVFHQIRMKWDGQIFTNLEWIAVDRKEVYAGTSVLNILNDF